MATVTLLKSGPRRINTRGFLFERDVPVEDIPRDIAETFEDDDRFKVKYTAADSDAPSREEAVAAQEEGETAKRVKPKSAADRYAAINAAADELDLDDDKNFTKDGKPDARALSSLLGWVVTSADRDAALKAVAPPSDTPVKAAGNVTIRRRAGKDQPGDQEMVDTGAGAAADTEDETNEDPTTDGSVDV